MRAPRRRFEAGQAQQRFLASQAAQRASQGTQRTASGAVPTFKPYTPYVQARPPTGTYDPAIDAQEGASHRGLADLVADDQRDTTRDLVDYGVKKQGIELGQSRGMEDFGAQRATLARSYARLGNQQAQQINAAGVGGGGAALQAAAKRAMNQGIDEQPIVTGEQRLQDDTTLNLGQLGLGYQRQGQDRATAEGRAKREDLQFGIDAAATRGYEAGAMGYSVPRRGEKGGIPSNERIGPLGSHTQTHVVNGIRYWVDPRGRIVKQQRA